MMSLANSNSRDVFKPIFKYYKQKASKPTFDDVIDFNKNTKHDVTLSNCTFASGEHNLGLNIATKLKVIHVNPVPGLYVIPNPFTDEGKSIWIKRCVEEYTLHPHETNINTCSQSLWKETHELVKSASVTDLNNNAGQLKVLKSCPIWKLRWATMGFHHDWNTKVYSNSRFSAFPSELAKLSKFFAGVVGWKEYKAQAAIVNFYHPGSTLSPHTDHSERDLSLPLISVSFGLPAIFLIGGSDKSVTPLALLIRSGDVVIMSGSSRLAYHAVPLIMQSSQDIPRNDLIDVFMAHSRINLNIRQVDS